MHFSRDDYITGLSQLTGQP